MPFDSHPKWHLMAKPVEGWAAMHRLRGVDRERGVDLLHWTVLPLGVGYEGLSSVIAMALREIDLLPFVIRWDRIVATGRYVLLKPSHVPREVRRLRRVIRKALAQAGITLTGGASAPHVTLNYRWAGAVFEEEIEPIVWRIREVMLIESLTGQAEHKSHGLFPLVPRQGFLFPWLAESKGTPAPALP